MGPSLLLPGMHVPAEEEVEVVVVGFDGDGFRRDAGGVGRATDRLCCCRFPGVGKEDVRRSLVGA